MEYPTSQQTQSNKPLPSFMSSIAKEVSIYTIAGIGTGVASKNATRMAFLYIGSGFIFLQVLAHWGWISIDWKEIERDAVDTLDQDGDNQLTSNDFRILSKKFMKYFAYKLPSAAAFGSGVAIGWKFL